MEYEKVLEETQKAYRIAMDLTLEEVELIVVRVVKDLPQSVIGRFKEKIIADISGKIQKIKEIAENNDPQEVERRDTAD